MESRGSAGEPWGWADAIQYLIGAGWRHGEVMQLTHAQLRLYSAAVARAYRARLRDELVNLRVAQADQAGFAKYLKELCG